MFRALRLTDKRWKEHLMRFNIIEKRAKGEINSDSESEDDGKTKIPMHPLMQLSDNSSPYKRPFNQPQSPQTTRARIKRATSIDEKRRPLKPGQSLMSSDESENESEHKSPAKSPHKTPTESRRDSGLSKLNKN